MADFDVDGALKAGYSPTEVVDFLAKDSGFDVQGARKAGYSDQELLTHLRPAAQKFDKHEKGLGAKISDEISSIPRQIGLTARYGLEGLGTIPEMLGNAMQAAGVKGAGGNAGKTVSDYLGLPVPETQTERVVGEGAKLLSPAGAFIKGGQIASDAPGIIGKIGQQFASAPAAQLQSAAGAGLTGQYIKETGGGDGAQFAGAIGGGVAAPALASVLTRSPEMMSNAIKNGVAAVAPNLVKPDSSTVNVTINNALKQSGITLDQLPFNVAKTLREDVANALKQGDNLDPAAMQRLVDYRMVGAIPRNANLTLDPVALTQQKNLAKLGANSKDQSAQLLARAENQNNNTLIEGLNGLGANTSQDQIGAAQSIMDSLRSKNDAAKSVIDRLYGAARNTDGRSAMLDPSHFTNTANDALDAAMLGGRIPSDIRNNLNKIANGEIPLTVDVAEQLKTAMGNLQRASSDPAERMAIGTVRKALDNTPLVGGQGQEAIDAFNKARRVNAAWMNVVDRTPALQAVRDGIEPDKFVSKFIIGNGDGASLMSVSQLKNLTKGNAEATESIRGQITSFLKDKALSGAPDETGKFSSSAFRKALDSIGDRKLNLFFKPEEVAQLKAIGRVANYEQVQPVGSAVNNSNTAPTMMATIFDRIGNSPVLSKIPLGKMLAEPAQNISVGMQSRAATNLPYALIAPTPKKPLVGAVSPAIGLLGFSE